MCRAFALGTACTLSSTQIGLGSSSAKNSIAAVPKRMGTVNLGAAAAFAVLATSAVTDAGGSQINGDMGTSTGIALPVYAPYSPPTPGLNGKLHPNDATAIAARAAAVAALIDIKARSNGETALGGVVELGGKTLSPGLYTATSTMQRECTRLFHCPRR